MTLEKVVGVSPQEEKTKVITQIDKSFRDLLDRGLVGDRTDESPDLITRRGELQIDLEADGEWRQYPITDNNPFVAIRALHLYRVLLEAGVFDGSNLQFKMSQCIQAAAGFRGGMLADGHYLMQSVRDKGLYGRVFGRQLGLSDLSLAFEIGECVSFPLAIFSEEIKHRGVQRKAWIQLYGRLLRGE